MWQIVWMNGYRNEKSHSSERFADFGAGVANLHSGADSVITAL
jgi:hypothetical protein